jgi:L-asparaginase II
MSVELLHYTRGKYVENIHRGDAVCVGVDGNIIDKVGNQCFGAVQRNLFNYYSS